MISYCRGLLTPSEEMNSLGFTNFEMFLTSFSGVFRLAEIETIQVLQSAQKFNKSKFNSYLQGKYEINKRHANGVIASAIGRLSSAIECRKSHIKQLKEKLKSANKWLKTAEKKVKSQLKFYSKSNWRNSRNNCLLPAACDLDNKKTHLQSLKFRIHNKKRYAIGLAKKIEGLKTTKLHVKVPSNNIFIVGSKDEKTGNQVVQWDRKQLKFRVPACLEEKFGKYVYTAFPEFERKASRLPEIGAKTWHFYYKNDKWIASVSFTPTPVSKVSKNPYEGVISLDDNPSGIGWSYLDRHGNLKAHGHIPLVQGLPKGKHLDNLVKASLKIYELALFYQCPVVKEELDFRRKKSESRENSRKLARMLSGWAYSKFDEILESILSNRGIELIRVNPAYTSIIGMVKYARQYGISSMVAAAIAIGRRGMKLSEKVPDSINALLDVKSDKHDWSRWNQLNKLIRSVGIKRHDFYHIPSLTEELKSRIKASGNTLKLQE